MIASAAAQRDRDIQRIVKDCPTNQSVAEQVRYLNRTLTHSNAYNSCVAAGNSSDADATAWKCVSALSGATGKNGPVCEGYSRAFKVLCDELGIPCVLVEGYAQGSLLDNAELHMWNYVQLDGKWYVVDTTWNDPRVLDNEYSAVSGKENEKYLLIGSNTKISSGMTFAMLHSVRNTVNSSGIGYINGPVLTTDAYQFEVPELKPTEPKPTEPGPTDPVVPDPVVPDPVVPDPVVPDPVVPDPVVPDPVMPDHYMDVAPYRSGYRYTAPERDGYVFAGWFVDQEMTEPLPENATTGYAFASFVDAQVLSVKCQLSDGTTAQSEQTDLRLLTAISTLQLQQVSFQISWEDAEIVEYSLYRYVLAHDAQVIRASDVFGYDAAYFMTATVQDIPQAGLTM